MLKSGDPDCMAMAARMTEARPKNRPPGACVSQDRFWLLRLFFGYWGNGQYIDSLRAGFIPSDLQPFDVVFDGVAPIAGAPVDPTSAAKLIELLSPVAAKNITDAMKKTVEFWEKRGWTVSERKVRKSYYEYSIRDGIRTPSDWQNKVPK